MAVTQYIGARYVPLFADPIDWNIQSAYEPLTIVYHQGNSYTSRQSVPTGIDITNNDYWAITGNYNAQVEQYRREVQTFDGRITTNAQAIADEVTARMQEDTAIRALITSLNDDLTTETNNREAADTQIRTDIAADIASEVATLNSTITTNVNRLDAQDSALSGRITTLENPTRYIACIGDSFGNEATEWPALTAGKTGYQLINRCTNEAGFTYNGVDNKTFIGQLQDIKNNANFANVEHIIVYGGVNDFNMQASTLQMKNAITSFMTEYNAISGYKPKLIFAFGNFGNGRLRGRASMFPDWYNEIAAWCRTIGVPLVEYVPSWLACSDTQLINTNDNLHPTEAGENVIASYVEGLINGTYTGVHRSIAKSRTGNLLTTSDTEVPNSQISIKEVLSIDNNVARVKLVPSAFTNVLGNDNLEGNTWYSFGSLFNDPKYWTSFGSVPTEMIIGSNFQNDAQGCFAFKVDPNTGKQIGLGLASTTVFNFGIGIGYWRCFGSLSIAKETFPNWATPSNAEYKYQMY